VASGDDGAVTGTVVLVEDRAELLAQRELSGFVEDRECDHRRSVAGTEVLERMLGGGEPPYELTALEPQGADAVPEQLVKTCGAPPLNCCTRSRRTRVLGRDAEGLADHAVGRPVRHADATAAAAHAHELIGDALLIGCEHRTKGRRHDVERLVIEWKRV